MSAHKDLIALARKVVNRAEALGLKGKKRDDMALNIIVGAAFAAEIAGDATRTGAYTMWAAMLIATRGYSEFERIVKEADAEQKTEEAPKGWDKVTA